MSETLSSAIYEGWVRHRRHAPRPHAFRYRMFMLSLDLDELDRVFQGRWLWSVERANLASFRRADYLGDPGMPLATAVRARVREATGDAPAGPVRLLAHLRYYGHCFNPVAFYYCYEADGATLHSIVAEVTNTPWRERHAYVLPLASAARHAAARVWSFDKSLHVSPFLPMQRQYRWRFTEPAASLQVHMEVLDGPRSEFDATLVMQRRPLDGAGLAACLARFPLMTLRVVGAIHWQALLIWLRRNPVYDHPSKSRT